MNSEICSVQNSFHLKLNVIFLMNNGFDPRKKMLVRNKYKTETRFRCS